MIEMLVFQFKWQMSKHWMLCRAHPSFQWIGDNSKRVNEMWSKAQALAMGIQ